MRHLYRAVFSLLLVTRLAHATDFSQTTYILKNKMYDKCLIVNHCGNLNQPPALIDPHWGGDYSVDVTNDVARWLLIPSGGGSGSQIVSNMMNGQCLVAGDYGAPGGQLVVRDHHWGADRSGDVTNDQARWLLAPSTGGSYTIQNVVSHSYIIGCANNTLITGDVTNDAGRWLLIPSRASGASSVFFTDPSFGSVFTLVDTDSVARPTIYQNVPTGEVHPDVIPDPHVPGRYMMAWTPDDPSPAGDSHSEIPCMAISTNKLTWTAIGTTPIIPSDGFTLWHWPYWFNSRYCHADPDLLYVDGTFRLFFQCEYPVIYQSFPFWPWEGVRSVQFPYSYTDDYGLYQDQQRAIYFGGTWAHIARGSSVLRDAINDRYLMYYDGTENGFDRIWNSSGGGDFKLSVGRATSPDGSTWTMDADPITYAYANDINPVIDMPDGVGGHGEVWHPSVRYFDGAYYAAAPGDTIQYYGAADVYMWKSLDGVNWVRSPGPVIRCADLPARELCLPTSAYRCALMFEGNTMYLWVSYNVCDGQIMERMALYKSQLSTAGLVYPEAPYVVDDYDVGGKVIKMVPRGSLGLPELVADLGPTACTINTTTFRWTAPADARGHRVLNYDVRVSTEALAYGNWNDGVVVADGRSAAAPGSTEQITVTGLTACTRYYLGIRTRDSLGVLSDVAGACGGTRCTSNGPCPLCDQGQNAARRAPQEGSDVLNLAVTIARPVPASESVDIEYTIPDRNTSGASTLAVFDVTGRQVIVLREDPAQPGRHSTRWDLRDGAGSRVRAGTYWLRLQVGSKHAERRVVVL